MSITVRPLSRRPKGTRAGRIRVDRSAFWSDFDAAVAEFASGGRDWAEIDGWQPYFATAQSATQSMDYRLRVLSERSGSRGPVVVRRAGGTLYFNRVAMVADRREP